MHKEDYQIIFKVKSKHKNIVKPLSYKIFNFFVLLLFIIVCQAYPFIYIHDHNNLDNNQLEICVHPPNNILHKDHACKEFSLNHHHFKVDWDLVKSYEKIKNIYEESFVIFLLNDFPKKSINIFFFKHISQSFLQFQANHMSSKKQNII